MFRCGKWRTIDLVIEDLFLAEITLHLKLHEKQIEKKTAPWPPRFRNVPYDESLGHERTILGRGVMKPTSPLRPPPSQATRKTK
jgi:hypothetical protein